MQDTDLKPNQIIFISILIILIMQYSQLRNNLIELFMAASCSLVMKVGKALQPFTPPFL